MQGVERSYPNRRVERGRPEPRSGPGRDSRWQLDQGEMTRTGVVLSVVVPFPSSP